MYITIFASILRNRKLGSFDAEELQPSKWYRCGRENPLSCGQPPFSRAQSLKASEGCTNTNEQSSFVSQNIWSNSWNFETL